MRHLLHFGIFVLALAAVTQADAQDRRRGDRHATVVIAAGGGPRMVRPVYDSRRSMDRPSRAVYDAQRAYFDQRQDLEQIVRIAERWEHAWLEREIRESIREPHHHRYTQRMRLLSDELARLERKKKHGHGYDGRGYDGRGYERRGYEGRGHRGYYRNKARILDELVMLSERQVQHARANVRYPFRLSFAHR